MHDITERAVQFYQSNVREDNRPAYLKFHYQVARCVAYEAEKAGKELSQEEFEELCNETIYWFNED